MVTPALAAAMTGPMHSLRKNRAQHGGHGFRLRLYFSELYIALHRLLVSIPKVGS